MEQETKGMLIGGFSTVMGLSTILVFVLIFLKKSKTIRIGYGFILGHFAFFTWSMIQGFKSISYDINQEMASEMNSLNLGITGVLWMVSMVFLIVALILFSKREK
jgi:hypothetical protein